ncbi:AAA family ATPase [Candidatus Palauibacter sp.]|uniref:AAA family ATPase n=1 Tax=Candidatus Palauibacter sp. TaxID=3101350 RepID=UPI003C6F2EAA
MRPEVRRLEAAMRGLDYIAEPSIVTAVHLARSMEKPLLVEGDAGVGKTEIAKVMAGVMETELIRLQCYEGLDANTALYEWNYQRQLLRLRMEAGEAAAAGSAATPTPPGESGEAGVDRLEDVIFGRRYLLERPLLRAITRTDAPPVLLIDEIDRADEGFEAFLLEVLSDFQVTIPELGTIRATHRPLVVLTSNRTREIGDALRRRCLYLYIEHPDFEKEVEIVRTKVPDVSDALAEEITHLVQQLRGRRLMKPPGVAETLDWARALVTLHCDRLDADIVTETLGCLIKDYHDSGQFKAAEIDTLVAAARAG